MFGYCRVFRAQYGLQYGPTENSAGSLEMYCSVQERVKTSGRFGNLMELYEQNYLQLRLLVPDLKHGELATHVSRVEGCLPVYLQLMEQSPYTTTLRLTYRFIGTNGRSMRAAAEPDLMLRVYHDARTAEVVSGLIHGQAHVQRQTRGLDNSWRLNRFLYKWVRYLHHRGHQFRLTETVDPAISEKPASADK